MVFLNLRHDRYWALSVADTRGFSHRIAHWPFPSEDGPANEPLLQQMTAGRLLVSAHCVHQCQWLPEGLEAPQSELAHGQPVLNGHLAPELWSVVDAVTTAWVLRHSTLERTAQRVGQRRARRQGMRQCAPSPDSYAHAARVFEALHPLVLASRNRCLFHSLALIEYLARHELYPRWVFGVQAVPFAAHCWVQQDGQVLNDTVEHVSRYTPILSI